MGDIIFQLIVFLVPSSIIFAIFFIFKSFKKSKQQMQRLEAKIDKINENIKKWIIEGNKDNIGYCLFIVYRV